MKRTALAALCLFPIVVFVTGCAGYREFAHPLLQPCTSSEPRPSPSKSGDIIARFMGVTTIVLDDGETAIMTDGFFSRPSKWQLLAGTIGPNEPRIDDALCKANITSLAAVLVAHSHHDHALDSPTVAKQTGARLFGSMSTENIARGQKLPADRILVIEDGDVYEFGRFKVTMFTSPHSPDFPYPGDIKEPLCPPTRVSDYREGGNYSFLVQHDARNILIQPSANFERGRFQNVRAEVVFLSIGKLGEQSEEFANDYWRETVQTTEAKLVIPIHWDDFTLALDQPLEPMPLLLDNVDRAMRMVRHMAERDHICVKFMPLFLPVDLMAAADAVPEKSSPCCLPIGKAYAGTIRDAPSTPMDEGRNCSFTHLDVPSTTTRG